ncbi:MAG: cell division protein FtsL [Selenomonadales bacterium]|nr:cell division protein FtsL [Selenomonadales bacterium]
MLVKERVVIEEPYEEYAPKKQSAPPRTKNVRKTKPNRRLLGYFAAIFMLLVLASTATSCMSAWSFDATKSLRTDKETLAKLVKENEHLQLDLARLKSPERIQAIAKDELKMSVPKVDYRPTTRSVAAPTPQVQVPKQTATNNIVVKMENFIKNIIS